MANDGVKGSLFAGGGVPMSLEYLREIFGEAHYLLIEIGVLVLGALTLIKWIRRDLDDLKGPKNKE